MQSMRCQAHHPMEETKFKAGWGGRGGLGTIIPIRDLSFTIFIT
jgi:hypothetical protein